MPAVPGFLELLKKMEAIHLKKNDDYAANNNAFENFTRSAELASWFTKDIDRVFVTLIGTKLARLATLLNKGGQPNNESIEDSFLDLTTYCALWTSFQSNANKSTDSNDEDARLKAILAHNGYQYHDKNREWFKSGERSFKVGPSGQLLDDILSILTHLDLDGFQDTD